MKYISDPPAGQQDPAVPQPAAAQPAAAQPAAAQPAAAQPTAYPPEPPAPPANSAPAGDVPPNPPAPAADVTVEPTPADQITPGDPAHRRVRQEAARTAATWLGLYRQPPSIRDAWHLSSIIDRRRIPDESGLLATMWWVTNRAERLLLFAVILLLLGVAITLLWCVLRPTHRYGLYLILLLVFVIIPSMTGG